jgi:hypothetical protein
MTVNITDMGGILGTHMWHELPTVLVGDPSLDEILQWV